MNKKSIILGLAAIVAAGTVTSCSNKKNVEVLVPEDIKLSELTSKYNENSPLTIEFWSGFGQSMTNFVEKQLNLFQLEYPYIKVIHEGQGGYDGVNAAVINALQADKYPDLVVGYPDHFASYIASNIQYSLDKFIEDAEVGMDLSLFNPQYMKENQSLMYKDEAKTKPYTMGIPFNKSTEVMVYNVEFFEAFDLQVPSTWDEAVAVGTQVRQILADQNLFGTKFTKENNGKKYSFDFTYVTSDNFYPLSYDSQANFFITMARQFGGKYTEMDDIEHGYLAFKDDEHVLEALNFIRSMHDAHILGIPDVWENSNGYCSKAFMSCQSIMTISSSAGVTNNIGGSVKRVGIAPIPYKTADKKFVISQGANLAILKTTKEKALASWLLIRFLTGGIECPARDVNGDYVRIQYNVWDEELGKYQDVMQKVTNREDATLQNASVEFAIESGYFPVTLASENSDRYKNYLNTESESSSSQAKKDAQRIANTIYIDPDQNWDKFVDSAFIGSSAIRTEVGKLIPMVIIGSNRLDPKAAIDRIYQNLAAYVRK